VQFHRDFRKVEVAGDFLVALALPEHGEHVTLAWRQDLLEMFAFPTARSVALGGQGQFGAQIGFAAQHRSDAVDGLARIQRAFMIASVSGQLVSDQIIITKIEIRPSYGVTLQLRLALPKLPVTVRDVRRVAKVYHFPLINTGYPKAGITQCSEVD